MTTFLSWSSLDYAQWPPFFNDAPLTDTGSLCFRYPSSCPKHFRDMAVCPDHLCSIQDRLFSLTSPSLSHVGEFREIHPGSPYVECGEVDEKTFPSWHPVGVLPAPCLHGFLHSPFRFSFYFSLALPHARL